MGDVAVSKHTDQKKILQKIPFIFYIK